MTTSPWTWRHVVITALHQHIFNYILQNKINATNSINFNISECLQKNRCLGGHKGTLIKFRAKIQHMFHLCQSNKRKYANKHNYQGQSLTCIISYVMPISCASADSRFTPLTADKNEKNTIRLENF